MVEIIGLGAVNEVGRSSILVKDRDRKILLDCGVKIIPRRQKKPSQPPAGLTKRLARSIDAVILSHAHLDHSGYIPALFRLGFRGRVFMTHPTQELVDILWLDHIKVEDALHYDVEHVDLAHQHVECHKYDEVFRVLDGITARFTDASHILGAASVVLDWDGEKILYTGDINNAKSPFHDPVVYPDPDEDIHTLITETTNGTRTIESRKEVAFRFGDLLKKTLEAGGKVVIPSFSMGRSQEIMWYLLNYVNSSVNAPIYVDGMINQMSLIYEKYMTRDWISPRMLYWLKEQDLRTPWDHPRIQLIPELAAERGRRRGSLRKDIAKSDEPSIILTTSGMMEGGPIISYLRYLGQDQKNLLATVGYQVPGTVGYDVISGKRTVEVLTWNDTLESLHLSLRRAHFSFSGHISPKGLEEYALYASPKKIYTVHGDHEAKDAYTQRMEKMGFYVSRMPSIVSLNH